MNMPAVRARTMTTAAASRLTMSVIMRCPVLPVAQQVPQPVTGKVAGQGEQHHGDPRHHRNPPLLQKVRQGPGWFGSPAGGWLGGAVAQELQEGPSWDPSPPRDARRPA